MDTDKPKRSKPQTSISLDPALIEEIETLAAANCRSRAGQIEWLVRRGLEAERRVRKKFSDTP